MKLSDYIKKLQEIEKECGDLECWYAKDDEGNGYQKIAYEPSTAYIEKSAQYGTDSKYHDLEELKSEEDLSNEEIEAKFKEVLISN